VLLSAFLGAQDYDLFTTGSMFCVLSFFSFAFSNHWQDTQWQSAYLPTILSDECGLVNDRCCDIRAQDSRPTEEKSGEAPPCLPKPRYACRKEGYRDSGKFMMSMFVADPHDHHQ
jgi:hypothetical protein